MGKKAVVSVEDQGVNQEQKRVFKVGIEAQGSDFVLSDHLAQKGHIPSAVKVLKKGIEELVSEYAESGARLLDEKVALEPAALTPSIKIEPQILTESSEPATKFQGMFSRQFGSK